MTQGTNFVFDTIAQRYDQCNHLFSLGLDRLWRKALVRAAAPRREDHVLDICTGTGDVIFSMLKHSPVRCLVGMDISEPMIHLAREKQIRLSSKRWMQETELDWKVMDAQSTDLPSGMYDLVTCAFGIRNIPDRALTLAQVNRLLKPAAQIAFLEFSLPAGLLPRLVFRFYLRRLMPFFGRFVTGDRQALRYLSDSIVRWHTQVDFARELSQAGFDQIKTKPLTLGIVTLWQASKTSDQSP